MAPFLAVLFLISSPGAFAAPTVNEQDCKSIDYSEKFGAIRNQTSAGWCWAFTAADLIGFAQGSTPDKQVSALDVAISALNADKAKLDKVVAKVTPQSDIKYMKMYWDHSLKSATQANPDETKWRSGRVGLPILALQTQSGACFESELPSQYRDDSKNKNAFLKDFITRQLDSLGDKSVQFDELKNLKYLAKCSAEKLLSPSTLVGLNGYRTALQLSASVNKKAITQIAYAIDKGACSSRTPMKDMYPMTFFPNAKSSHERLIANSLRSGTPVGISYDADFLTMGRKVKSEKRSGHISSIVGMRWNSTDKICEFKLRNSWGESCKSYAPEFKKSCDKGNIWIRGSDLNERASSMTTVEIR